MARPKKATSAAKAAPAGKSSDKVSKNPALPLIRADLKHGEKKLYLMLASKQIPDGSWAVEVTRGGLGHAAQDNVQIQTIGYKPKPKDKVWIEKNYSDTTNSKELLTLTKGE